jgi:Ni/Fe-hydrogenase subunit HybB-like protein
MAMLYYFFDFKFRMPVFAVYSSFIETKMFAVFKTNFADELIMLLLISGLGLIVFSKEKYESQNLDAIRASALAKATILNIIFLLFSVLFIYGSGFITCLVLNLFTLPVFYLVFFYIMKRKKKDF